MIEHLLKLFTQASKAVRAYKLRTFFCSLSIALGIGAITVIVASVEGAYKKAYEIIDRFGPDSVLVIGGSQEKRVVGIRERTLTLHDIKEIEIYSPTAYMVVPMTSKRNVTVSYKNKRHQTRIIGSTEQYSTSWTWPIEEGGDFTVEDLKGLRNACIIGREIVKNLFYEVQAVGKFITIEKLSCEVVGILSARGAAPSGQNLDDRVVMPISTVMRKLLNESKFISAIRIRYMDEKNLSYRVEELRKILRRAHKLDVNEPDDFRIISPKEIIKFLVVFTGVLVVYLGSVGIISLVVAGFVIANLFLISVSERRMEIGIRRSTGATKRDIFVQILMEILIISSVGSLLGYGIGIGISSAIEMLGEFPMHFTYRGFFGGMALSWIIGFVFGLNPAQKAAELNPIEAIRI